MSHWFRLYSEVLDDPKVQKLDPASFKHWINLLCLASRSDGVLPPADDIAFALRIDAIALGSLLDRLLIAGLIDVVKGGPHGSRIAIHGWRKRQYKSDSSSERVKRFRQRSQPVSETPPESETESESENPPDPPAGGAARGRDLKPEHVVGIWNELAARHGLPPIARLTAGRKRKLRARLAEHSAEEFKAAIQALDRSPFLHGRNERGWRPSFDFLLQPGSFVKLIEGYYDQSH